MLTMYPACFFKDENSYSVIFPDLNYLATCGDNLEDAMKMAIDCLAGYLYTGKQDGDDMPQPSKIEDIDISEVAKELEISDENSFKNIVSVDVEEYARNHFNKSVKKTLTIPQWLNDLAIENNINFSKILQEALKSKLNIAQ
nr:MAG TPA: hypothetical protein [Bacteriophage sp.]